MLHPALILVGVWGGAAAFGLIGVFLGPTLLAVDLRLWQQWTAGQFSEGPAPASLEMRVELEPSAPM